MAATLCGSLASCCCCLCTGSGQSSVELLSGVRAVAAIRGDSASRVLVVPHSSCVPGASLSLRCWFMVLSYVGVAASLFSLKRELF